MFSEHPDYTTDIRRDVFGGVLADLEVARDRLFVHLTTGYAARVSDFATYHAVSLDLLHRWAYPLIPDNNFTLTTSYVHCRGNIYREDAVEIHRSVGCSCWFSLFVLCPPSPSHSHHLDRLICIFRLLFFFLFSQNGKCWS